MATTAQVNLEERAKDRRYLPRWDTELKVSWQKLDGGHIRVGTVSSLGCGGACIKAESVFAPNEKVRVVINLSGQPCLEVKGIVRWNGKKDDQRCAGIYFTNVDDATQDAILHRVLREQHVFLRDYMFKGWK